MQTQRQGHRPTGGHIPPGMRREIVDIIDERISQVHVTRHDFTELKDIVASLGQEVRGLTEAQIRTEKRLDSLEENQAQGFQSLSNQISALGSRWGIYNEATFRATLQGIFAKMEGVTIREGNYGGRQVDVVIRNGEHILLEITSRMHAKDIDHLYCSADDYQAREGVAPLLMVATSYVSPRLMQKIMGLERKIDIFSYDGEEEQ